MSQLSSIRMEPFRNVDEDNALAYDYLDIDDIIGCTMPTSRCTFQSSLNQNLYQSLDDPSGRSQNVVLHQLNTKKADQIWSSTYYEHTKTDIEPILEKVSMLCQPQSPTHVFPDTIMFLHRLLQIEAKQLKKKDNRKWLTEAILKSRVICSLYKCDYKCRIKILCRPLLLLLANLWEEAFDDEAIEIIKPKVFSLMRYIESNQQTYWTCMILDKIIMPRRMTRQEANSLQKFLISSVTPKEFDVTNEIRFNLKLISDMSAQFPGLMEQLYSSGLIDSLQKICTGLSGAFFNFLEAVHGKKFQKEFSDRLLIMLAQKIMDPSLNQSYQLKICMRIFRRRLQTLTQLSNIVPTHQGPLIELLNNEFLDRLVEMLEIETDENTKNYGYLIIRAIYDILKSRNQKHYRMLKCKLKYQLEQRLKNQVRKDLLNYQVSQQARQVESIVNTPNDK